MAAAKKTPAPPSEAPFTLPVPFAPKTPRSRAPRKPAASPPAASALPTPLAPVVQPLAVEPPKPRRKRLAKAFDRPLDKELRKKSVAAVAPPKKAEKSTVSDRFSFPKAEHDRLVELKKQLAEQGVTVKKSDLIRVGLVLALSIPQAKLKAVLAKLPAAK